MSMPIESLVKSSGGYLCLCLIASKFRAWLSISCRDASNRGK